MSGAQWIRTLPQIEVMTDSLLEAARYLTGETEQEELQQLAEQLLHILCSRAEALGVQLPEELTQSIPPRDMAQWSVGYRTEVYRQMMEHFQSEFADQWARLAQCTGEEMEAFVQTLARSDLYPETKAHILFQASQYCSRSVPEQSFRYAMESLHQEPGLLRNFASFMDGYVYDDGVFAAHRELRCCPICGGEGEPYQKADQWRMADWHRDNLPEKLWMRCRNCRNLYSRYFPGEYYGRNQYGRILPDHSVNCPAGPATLERMADLGDRFGQIRQYTAGKRCLEIGIGDGALAAVALELGYSLDLLDIVEEQAVKYANLLDQEVLCGDFLEYPEDKRYDVISMGDVIEHIPKPREALEKAYRILNEGGVLLLSTPNYQSCVNHIMGESAPLWQEPGHITYFCREGMEYLLQELGFEVLEYKISTSYRGSMEFLARKPNKP